MAPYHHGDLRNALVRAAADLAEASGPDAVTVRAVARAVGVTPTAAYRHFASQAELFRAVKHEAMERMTQTMLSLATEPASDADPVTVALDRVVAAGRGYIEFARSQPGLFRTAFCRTEYQNTLADAPPYTLAIRVLDDLVELGWLDPARQEEVATAAWATVHGLSMLLLDVCTYWTDSEREQVITSTLDFAVRGLGGGQTGR